MYNRIAQGFFGGLLDPELEKRLTEQQRRAAQSRGMMDLGMGLLAASGPSRTPVSFGQALAHGMQAGQQGFVGGALGSMEMGERLRAMDQAKAQEEAQRSAQQQLLGFIETLPEPQRSNMRAILAGGGAPAVTKALQKRDEIAAKPIDPKRSSYSQTAIDMGLAEGTPEHRQMVERLATQSKAPVVNVRNSEYTPFDKAMGSKDAESFATWRDAAMQAGTMLEGINVMRQINSLQQGGKIGEAAALVGRYFGSDAAANMQTFQAAQNQLVLKQAEALKGAMSDRDIQLLEETLPQFGNDPRANAVILDILERAANRSIQNYEAADAYASQNRSLRGFRPMVQVQAPLGDVRIGQPGGGSAVSLDGLSAEEIQAELRRRRGR